MCQRTQPIPLANDQITRIQLAAKIIKHERLEGNVVLNNAVGWMEGKIPTTTFEDTIIAYLIFKDQYATLPI
jgi:hypothetical protein